jgi:glycosyltransferase involved in cell wall biosynthesis
MKIGIGVISYNRPDECQRVCEGILQTLPPHGHDYQTICCLDQEDTSGYEFIDKYFGLDARPNRGIAVNKNRVLKQLKDNDYIFLFEDDLMPKQKGWIELYIEAARETKMEHFNHIRLDHRENLLQVKRYNTCTMGWYERNTAQLMVFTRNVINTVGAFDERYGRYGFEHSDYTRRCKEAGLCMPRDHGRNHFIMESDLFFTEIDQTTSLPQEEIDECTKKAHEIYMKFDRTKIYIPFSEEDY